MGGIELAAGQRYTLVAAGELAPEGGAAELQLIAFEDQSEGAAGKAALRAIHASPDAPAVDVGAGAGNMFQPLFTNVAFGKTGMSNGSAYLQIDPVAGGSISVRATGGPNDALTVADLDFKRGSLSTLFVIGNVDGSPAPLGLLVCEDNAPPANKLAACNLHQ
jgi:hypothetical protein